MINLDEKDILLTGDRPSGKLHLGHYVGSLKNRVSLQNNCNYKQFVFLADIQVLTDRADKSGLIKSSVVDVALDYLSVGIDPDKTILFIQSQIPQLCELTMYFMNLVTLARLQRNPTVKEELKNKSFGESIPTGFMVYPISQAADIAAFRAKYVPVGEDQLPLIEQAREIVRSFNSLYGEVLVEPQAILSDNEICKRLPGIDGKNKMSKTLNNAIYLSDEPDVIKSKIMSMYTDPNHINVSDPGKVEGNPVFIYLDAFYDDIDNLQSLKEHYQKGGLGDVKVKKLLNDIIQAELEPIRNRRKEFAKNIDFVYKVLKEGSVIAEQIAAETLSQVKKAMGLDYFSSI